MVEVLNRTRSKYLIPALLAVGVVASRVPFLGYGYGEDPDAWRAMIAAQHLLNTGSYVPSRTPGYPLPEYVDALLLAVGLGSSLWVGLVSAAVCAVAAVLVYYLFEPLGWVRALIGALAFAFTPVMFVASISAMDHVWGLAFFLAATMAITRDRRWLVGLLLGLAVASRPTYAVAAIPLVLLHGQFDVRRLAWKRVLPPLLLGALVAVVFYIPAFLSTGTGLFSIYDVTTDRWVRVAYLGSVGLFGVVGFCAVGVSVLSALHRRNHGRMADTAMNGWAFTVIILWGLMFIRLPHDASYLLPAVVALYWLLCRYTNRIWLWVTVAALVVSCFALRVDSQTRSIGLAGPAVWNVQVQNQRNCITGAVRDVLEASPTTYVVAGSLRPQLVVQLGEPLSQRVLYIVRPDGSRLVDTEAAPFPQDAELVVLDTAVKQQTSAWPQPIPVLNTENRC